MRLSATLGWLGWGVALAVAGALLAGLAQHQLVDHLERSAALRLAQAARGETPYRWRFRSPEEIVRGRPFGARDSRFDADGLHLRGRVGADVEIGMVLSTPVDLRRYSQLLWRARGAAAGSHLVVRETLSGPLRLTPLPAPDSGPFDLSRAVWQDDRGETAPAPTRAAMLRLRLPAAADSDAETVVTALQLDPAPSLQAADLDRPLRMWPSAEGMPGPNTALAVSRATLEAERLPDAPWSDTLLPLFALEGSASAEQTLALRDRLRADFPSALLLPGDDLERVRRAARGLSTHAPVSPAADAHRGVAVGAFALGLVLLRWRPPRRPALRAGAQILGVFAVPIWLILAGHFGDNPAPWVWAMLGLALLFAASLSWGDTARRVPPPADVAATRRAWRGALAVVLLALAVGVLLGNHAPQLPDVGHVARYLVWAGLQQWLLCVVLADRLRTLSASPRWVGLGAAGVFALLHTPNQSLMQFTLLGAVLWVPLWLRYRCLLPLAVSHAACGLLLGALLPVEVLRSAEVSARFFLP